MPTGVRFPVDLPNPTRDYGDSDEESRSAFQPEVGMTRRRMRYRSTPRLFEVSFHFTQAQFEIFDLWWQNTIQGSARPFDIQLLDADETLTWFTVYWIGAYAADVTTEMEWRVRGTLRATEGTFGTVRPSGSDELATLVNVVANPRATLRVGRDLRSIATSSIATTGRLSVGGALRGVISTGLGANTRAKLGPFPLRGLAQINIDATATIYIPIVHYYPGASRTWQRIDWFGTAASQDVRVDTGVQRAWMEL